MGKNILQYPWLLSRHAACAARRRQPTVDNSGRPKDRWRIRFVRQEDKRQLVEWRESNDKRLWQKAVTVLDNRSLIPEGIAKKLELPVDAIRDWITTYNHKGLAGLNPPRKKRSPGKKGAALERKRKGVLALIHSRPQAFGINRASWNQPSLAAAYKQFMERRFQKALSVGSSGKLATRSKKHVECFPALIPSIEKRSIWFWVLFEIFNQTSFSSSLMNWAR